MTSACSGSASRSAVLAAALAAFGMEKPAAAQANAPPCQSVREHAGDTVIVFEPPSTFTICRDGSVQEDVVTERPVYFELAPTPGSGMFDFRVHGHTSEWAPTGLAAWEERASRIVGGLRDLEESNEPISALSVPVEAPAAGASPLRSVAAARSRYLGVVTPRYLELLAKLRSDAGELPVIASVVTQWCSELAAHAPPLLAAGAALQPRCAAPHLRAGALERDVETFESAARRFDVERSHARDATVGAIAHPEDAAAVSEAARALDAARVAAESAVMAAHPLRETSKALVRDLMTLRAAIRSLDAIRPGVATYLARYSAPGNAELEIDATPVEMTAAGDAAVQKTSGKTTARFPVVGRHYLDLEAGLGVTSGLPSIPTVAMQANAVVLQGKPVDEFVGLALVELEPARFFWPDRPLAGLLRLPVIGVPFTRDPTQNFFVGAGVGWTGIGSITAGPYLLRELTLRSGYSIGQQLPAGTALDAATDPALQVGYFVSASVDLMGLFHLFFPVRPAAIDAATGKEK